MTRRAWLAGAVFVLLALAGCTEAPSDPDGDEAAPAPGVVAGRVLDEAGLPIADARVALLLSDRHASTDADGAFRLVEVAPGPVVVVASKPGHASETLRDALPPAGTVMLSFRLVTAPSLEPRHFTHQFEGLVVCGLPAGVGCGPAVEETAPHHPFEVEAGLQGILLELAWTPPVEGVARELRVEASAATAAGCGEPYGAATGASVLRLAVAEGFPIAGGHQCALVWPAADAAVQQGYELYVTLFYHAPMPDGFSAVPG